MTTQPARIVAAPIGHERLPRGEVLERHRHNVAYAAIVLAGRYEEAGNAGRCFVEPGLVVLHDAFDSHLNRFGLSGEVFNVPLGDIAVPFKWGRVRDADRIARIAVRDLPAARALLFAEMMPVPQPVGDWPDRLLRDLCSAPNLSLTHWAIANGVARETLSRGFGRVFGLTPAAFRAEARARQAWRRLLSERTPLAQIGAQCGFADQAHMTRAIVMLTGRAPGAWRTSHSFKTSIPATA